MHHERRKNELLVSGQMRVMRRWLRLRG